MPPRVSPVAIVVAMPAVVAGCVGPRGSNYSSCGAVVDAEALRRLSVASRLAPLSFPGVIGKCDHDDFCFLWFRFLV